MYEARQNKEKVSRRIDGGGSAMARQRKKKNGERFSFVNIMQFTSLDESNNEIERHKDDFACMLKIYKKESNSLSGSLLNDSNSAKGLLHWSRETRRAAVEHYNELFALRKAKSINGGFRLGNSNVLEADIVNTDREQYIEVKTNNTDRASDVDKLVNNALSQLYVRYISLFSALNPPRNGNKRTYYVYIYLENNANKWPFTTSENFNENHLSQRFSSRKITLPVVYNDGKPSRDNTTVNFVVFYSFNNLGYKNFSIYFPK